MGAGVAGGADVILIPEIPYDLQSAANAIRKRQQRGTNFSIVAVAEGALCVSDYAILTNLQEKKARAKEKGDSKAQHKAEEALQEFNRVQGNSALKLSQELEVMTGLESRLTILGHYQRGGTPSAADRMLATRLGSACVDCIEKEEYGVMIAVHGEGTKNVPLKDVVGKKKLVPPDHPWIRAARNVGTCLGD